MFPFDPAWLQTIISPDCFLGFWPFQLAIACVYILVAGFRAYHPRWYRCLAVIPVSFVVAVAVFAGMMLLRSSVLAINDDSNG